MTVKIDLTIQNKGIGKGWAFKCKVSWKMMIFITNQNRNFLSRTRGY